MTDPNNPTSTPDQQSPQPAAKKLIVDSFYVEGWRPAAGWLCVAGLAWSTVFQPMLEWVAVLCGSQVHFSSVSSAVLMNLLLALLGMSGWRSLDKFNKVDTNGIVTQK